MIDMSSTCISTSIVELFLPKGIMKPVQPCVPKTEKYQILKFVITIPMWSEEYTARNLIWKRSRLILRTMTTIEENECSKNTKILWLGSIR